MKTGEKGEAGQVIRHVEGEWSIRCKADEKELASQHK
jgi:hypothetical protein